MHINSKILAALISFSLAFTSLPANAKESPMDSTLKEMKKLYNSSKNYSLKTDYNLVFSPSFTRKEQKRFIRETNRSISFWQDGTSLGKINILFWKAKDLSWAKTKYKKLGKGWNVESEQLEKDVQTNNKKIECVGSNIRVFHRNPNTNSLELNHLVRLCVDERPDPWGWHVISHEIAHIWQFSTHPMETNMKHPWWLLEGSATFYGAALGAVGREGGKEYIKQRYPGFLQYRPGPAEAVYKKLFKNPSYLYTYLTKDLNQSLNEKYFFGSVVVSEIVKKYGHKKFLQFYKSFNQNPSLDYNFKLVFSEDFEAFCDTIVQDFINHF